MKNIIPIFLLLPNLIAYSENCDTVNGKKRNCVDSIGQKQGYWEEEGKWYSGNGDNITLYRPPGRYGTDGDPYFYRITGYGYYKNNKKINKWIYYYKGDDYTKIENKITYFDNGDKLVENYESAIQYNNDSSDISGYVLFGNDSIDLKCKTKHCGFSYYGKEILSFDYIDFFRVSFEILRFNLGVYAMEIKLIKQNTIK